MIAKLKSKAKAAVKLMPAVGYIRMSSDKQEASPAQQRAEIQKLAERLGHEIVRWYTDEGISGAESDRRPSFQRLIADAQSLRDFEAILCWDQDRFSRFDPMEANYYWFLLKQANVRIVTACQGELDFANLGGWLTASVMQHGKAQYLRDLSRNVIRGRLAKAMQGKYVGGRPPFGYVKTPDGELVLDEPEKVAAIRWIFETYINEDVGLLEIVHRLNERGLPAPGRRWCLSAVQKILHRNAYLGELAQFRYQKGKFHTVRDGAIVPITGGRGIIKPESDWLTVPCPPIIDRETWDAAQAKLEERRHRTTPKPNGGRALLTGLMFCGDCGGRMYAAEVPRTKDKTGKRDLVYCCSSYNREGTHGCHRNPVHEAAILPYIIGQIQETVLSPANLDRLKAAIQRKSDGRKQAKPVEDGRLRAQLAKLDADVSAAVRELKRTPDDLYDLAVADVRELRAKRDQLAAKVEALDARPAPVADNATQAIDRALAQLYTLRERIASASPQVAREALRRICSRIEVSFEHRQFEKITRSRFKRGIVHFAVAELFPPASKAKRLCKLPPSIVFGRDDLAPVEFEPRATPAADAAAEFLRKYLADGPKPLAQIVKATSRFCGTTALHRVRQRLGIETVGGPRWVKWRLPESASLG